MKIGVLANPNPARIGPTVDRFLGLAAQKGIDVMLADDLKGICQGEGCRFCDPDDLVVRSDIVVAMGGDGTILRAAALARRVGTPILGVNLGRLGFLAGAAPGELEESLERLLDGNYEIEERMALDAQVGDQTAFSLNEIVIEKGVTPRMVQVKTWIADASVSSFFGNGVIVATPTGSTGYNLSAGGPLIDPSIEAFIVTPICPHSLSQRPVVIPGDRAITVQVIAEHTDIMLTADGQTVSSLQPEERVIVKRASEPVRLVNLQGLSFYEVLRRKLDWSLDGRERQE